MMYKNTVDKIIASSRLLSEREECPNVAVSVLACLLGRMGFPEDRALAAAARGRSFEGSLQFLKNARFMTCTLCYRESEPFMMFKLIPCGHELCKNCCRRFFSTKIRNEPVLHLTCYECSETIDAASMCPQLKDILEPCDYTLLDQKLLDATLQQENVKYCPTCRSGFIVDPTLRRPQCPYCKAIMCANCWFVWADQHKNVSCDDFKRWKQENEPEFQESLVEGILSKEGIDCPNCGYRYSLARGGCLHFNCIRCKYEFCSCCKSQFSRGEECSKGHDCADKGIHAHHPRNCFYHVRDYSVNQLVSLIKESGFDLDESPAKPGAVCTIMVTDDCMKDIPCDKLVCMAHRCKRHFLEYLGEIIIQNRIDSVSLMEEDQLKYELKKNAKQVPERHSSEDIVTYCDRLREIIKENLPLE